MRTSRKNRVVVTGMGIVSAIGNTLSAFETALFSGQPGIGPITLFDVSAFACRLGGQVNDATMRAVFPARTLKRTSRCDLLGMIAAREAMSDAGFIPAEADYRKGIVLGGGAGGMLAWEAYRRAQWQGRRPPVSGLFCSPPCTLTDRIATQYGLAGYRATVTTACSSSTAAIGAAYDLVSSGDLCMAVTGGSEALSELTFAGFNSLRVMSDEPCRPFDKERKGLSLGEGAAVIVLEEYNQAVERGAKMYGEIRGYAINSDAYHITAPHPEGRGMRRVMADALANAGIDASQVDYINAHGTATPVNDPLETSAIKAVFSESGFPPPAVSSTKSMVGHCLGAAGGIEAVAALLAVHRGILPPTAGLVEPDPACDLDYVPLASKQAPIRYALSNSFAFGGNNACIVFGRI